MSDFNYMCDVFDIIGLKYIINEGSNYRQIVISDDKNTEFVDMNEETVAAWFEFDSSGTFYKFIVED